MWSQYGHRGGWTRFGRGHCTEVLSAARQTYLGAWGLRFPGPGVKAAVPGRPTQWGSLMCTMSPRRLHLGLLLFYLHTDCFSGYPVYGIFVENFDTRSLPGPPRARPAPTLQAPVSALVPVLSGPRTMQCPPWSTDVGVFGAGCAYVSFREPLLFSESGTWRPRNSWSLGTALERATEVVPADGD